MGPGDEAIVFAPYFPEYAVYAEAAGGSVRVVPCRADTFALDLDALAAAVHTAAEAAPEPPEPPEA